MFKSLCTWLLMLWAFCYAVRDIYRGYHQPDLLLIVRGGFIVALFVVIGVILVTFPNRQPPKQNPS